MKLLRKPGHVSIFPTSRQSGLGAIPGSEFQFPFGIKWSTNYNFAIGWKLSSKGPTQHFPWVGSIIALSRPTVPGQSETVTCPSLSLPISPSLPFPAPWRPSSWCSLSLFLPSPTKNIIQILGKEIHHGLSLAPTGWSSAHGVISASSLCVTSPWSINSLEEKLTHPKLEFQRLLFPGPWEGACLCPNRKQFTSRCVAPKLYLCFSPNISEARVPLVTLMASR